MMFDGLQNVAFVQADAYYYDTRGKANFALVAGDLVSRVMRFMDIKRYFREAPPFAVLLVNRAPSVEVASLVCSHTCDPFHLVVLPGRPGDEDRLEKLMQVYKGVLAKYRNVIVASGVLDVRMLEPLVLDGLVMAGNKPLTVPEVVQDSDNYVLLVNYQRHNAKLERPTLCS